MNMLSVAAGHLLRCYEGVKNPILAIDCHTCTKAFSIAVLLFVAFLPHTGAAAVVYE